MSKLFMMSLIAILILGASCTESSDPTDSSDSQEPVNDSCSVLFLGNSLTHYNGMPYIFEEMSEADGKKMYVHSLAVGGVYLNFFARDFQTYKLFRSRKWDYIVLQGTSNKIGFLDSHYVIRPFVRQLLDSIRAIDPETVPVLFMRWGWLDGYDYGEDGELHIDFLDFQPMINDGTVKMAHEMKMLTAPVGEAWLDVIQERSDTLLYLEDMVHPTYTGSFLTASVFYSIIHGKPSTENSYIGNMNPDSAVYYKKIATDVVFDDYERWQIPD